MVPISSTQSYIQLYFANWIIYKLHIYKSQGVVSEHRYGKSQINKYCISFEFQQFIQFLLNLHH